MIQPPASELLATQAPEDRDYLIVTAELGTLRQRFESLRQARAEQLHTVEEDYVSGDTLPQALEWSVSDEQATVGVEEEPYFSMLEQISNREVEAQRLENETMFREIQRSVIARRGSDPTHLANAAPTPSIFMGKALTETALPMLSSEPKVKSRLPAWLLARLKEDPLQRTMYRNILVHRGLQSPVGESWEDRAAHFWDTDNASNCEPEYKDIDGDEDADEDADFDGEDSGSSQTRATSHELSLESSSRSRIKLEGVSTIAKPGATSLPFRSEHRLQTASTSSRYQELETLGSRSCEAHLSQIFVLNVKQSTRAKSDHAVEKGYRERISESFSKLRRHKRTHSASYVFGNHDANYGMRRKISNPSIAVKAALGRTLSR